MFSKSLFLSTLLLGCTGDSLASKTYESSSNCKVSLMSSSSAKSVTVAKFAVSQVHDVLCGHDDQVPETASVAATAIADSFAEAIVDLTATCYAEGNAQYKVNGKSIAMASATAIAKAYAKAQSQATTCGKCAVSGTVVAESFEKIFLKATAEAEISLDGMASGSAISDVVSIFSQAIVSKTVKAFAKAISHARADDVHCSGGAQVYTEAGEPHALNTAGCKVDVSASAHSIVMNALASVSSNVAASACHSHAPVRAGPFELQAKSIGQAMARAVTEISAECQVKGGGFACAVSTAHITSAAEAIAIVFVEGFVRASSKCTHLCYASKTVLVKAMTSVLASATSKAMKHQCTGPESHFTYFQTETVIVEASITAIAKLISQATVPYPGACIIGLEHDVSVIPSSPVHGDDLYPYGQILHRHVPHPAPSKPTHGSKKMRSSSKAGRRTKKGRRHGGKKSKKAAKKGGRKGRHGKKARKGKNGRRYL